MEIIPFKKNSKLARRTLSKALTCLENGLDTTEDIIKATFSVPIKSKIFGITGAPGAGKSSLINLLLESFLKDGLSVAVLAIDPSSPFSGGALLGDRTRMYNSSLSNQLYIRSSSSRGHLGGISPKTPEMLNILNAFQFDIIIVETVGVGQAELDIMRCAHLTAVVLSPNMGDSLQALKAGIIEIADLFILNKADIPSVSELEKDIIFSLSLGPKNTKRPQIVKTSCTNDSGIPELKQALLEEYKELERSGILKSRIKQGLDFQLTLNLQDCLNQAFNKNPSLANKKAEYQELMYKGKMPPREAAQKVFNEVEKKSEKL